MLPGTPRAGRPTVRPVRSMRQGLSPHCPGCSVSFLIRRSALEHHDMDHTSWETEDGTFGRSFACREGLLGPYPPECLFQQEHRAVSPRREVVQGNQPPLDSGAISGTQCWSPLLADWVLSSGRSQASLEEGSPSLPHWPLCSGTHWAKMKVAGKEAGWYPQTKESYPLEN